MSGQKLNNEAVEKFLSQKKFKKGNMQVELSDYYTDDNVIRLKQHGNTIAKIENGEIFISNAGWESVTTKEKLNCLLSKLNKGYIQQIKGVWYWQVNNQKMTNKEIIQNSIKFPYDKFVSVEYYLNHILLGE